jgi:hypothetical protein
VRQPIRGVRIQSQAIQSEVLVVRRSIELLLIILTLSALAVLPMACSSENHSEQASGTEHHEGADMAEQHAEAGADAGMTEEQRLNKTDPHGTYGAGLKLHETMDLSAVLEAPETYEGKTVQVSGVVNEVCPRRGCWIELADAKTSETMRVKVTDGEIVFPLSAKNETAVVEGVVERIEMTEDEYRNWKQHMAEEQGEEFDPASVTGPATIWRIRGEGARIGS